MNNKFSCFISTTLCAALPSLAFAVPASENFSSILGQVIETESIAMFSFGALALMLSRRLVKSS